MEKISETELWLINTTESQKVKNEEIAMDLDVIGTMPTLMEFPFSGTIEHVYENSVIVLVNGVCPIEQADIESEKMKLTSLAGRIVVPFKNLMYNDKLKLKLNSVDSNLNVLRKNKNKIISKIKKAEKLIETLTEENNKHKEEQSRLEEILIDSKNRLTCAKSKRRELLKWQSSATEGAKEASANITKLEKSIENTQIKLDTINDIRDHNRNDIANLQVKIGQLELKRKAAQYVLDKAIEITTTPVSPITQHNCAKPLVGKLIIEKVEA